jgi:transcription elongation factor Elf1
MKDTDTEIIFKCRKCEHHLFVEVITLKAMHKVSKYECPNCGEEGNENWILVGIGNSEDQKDEYNFQ